MEFELNYYKWLFEKASAYKKSPDQRIYNDVKESIRTLSMDLKKKYPILAMDLNYIMQDGISIDDTISLLENRIFGINCEKKLFDEYPLIKELYDAYDYLGYVKRIFAEYGDNDPSFCETFRITNKLIDNYNNGRYDSLKEFYPNLGIILQSDQKNLTNKYKCFEYNVELTSIRKRDFSSFVRKPIKSEEIEVQNEFFAPIIKQCFELDNSGNYDKIRGFKHYKVNYNGTDLHVYLNCHDLYVSKDELVSHYPLHEPNGDTNTFHSNICYDMCYDDLDLVYLYASDVFAINNRRCSKSDIDKLLNEKKKVFQKK